jgi:AraC-like DNA-binding protein/ligand-binding sensor protein
MNMIDPANIVRQLSRSRLYEDFERAFQKATNLPLQLASVGTWQDRDRLQSKFKNSFCSAFAPTSEMCDSCVAVHGTFVTKPSDTWTLRCFAGFTYTSVPLKWDGRVMGYLQTGPVLLRPPTAALFNKISTLLINRGIKVDPVRLERAYFRSRVASPGRYHAAVRLLEIFAGHLSLVANQIPEERSSRDSHLIRRAKGYIANHQLERIKLREIAQALNVSTFYFCRKFKQETGLTFVTYLNRARIERAKVLLRNKNLHVTEIAYEVGFQSVTHFNRIFRKLVGYAATEYRSTLNETI